jgi:hypothetical protein
LRKDLGLRIDPIVISKITTLFKEIGVGKIADYKIINIKDIDVDIEMGMNELSEYRIHADVSCIKGLSNWNEHSMIKWW